MVMKSRAEKLNLEFSILRQCDDLTHSAYKLMSSNHICMYFHELQSKKKSALLELLKALYMQKKSSINYELFTCLSRAYLAV